MNKRILKLFNEAGFHQLEMERLGIEDKFEKFAELIVKECSKVITHGGYWSGGIVGGGKRQCTPPEIAKMIREHFGVEE